VNEGYVKLYRQITEWQWFDDPNTLKLFLFCLVKANYQPSIWKGVEIPIGSFVTSSEKLADSLLLGRQQVRRALGNLQTTSEITIKTTNKYIVINVANWAKYQIDVSEFNQQELLPETKNSTIKQPSNNHQTTTVKEIKELKEGKNKELKAFIPFNSPLQPIFYDFANGDEELYNAMCQYKENRKAIKKPMTVRACELLCTTLTKLAAQGENLVDCINQSISRSYSDIYPVSKQNGNKNQKDETFEEMIARRVAAAGGEIK